METEPHVLDLNEFETILNDQEKQSEMDKFLLVEVLTEPDVIQNPVTEENQSNQVCLF